jgi:hypothetical protein
MNSPTAALTLVLLPASTLAADVDGKWTGAINPPMGDVPVSFTFKADGTDLTGSTTGPDGSETKISGGRV